LSDLGEILYARLGFGAEGKSLNRQFGKIGQQSVLSFEPIKTS
jgi:hypothetical protein